MSLNTEPTENTEEFMHSTQSQLIEWVGWMLLVHFSGNSVSSVFRKSRP